MAAPRGRLSDMRPWTLLALGLAGCLPPGVVQIHCCCAPTSMLGAAPVPRAALTAERPTVRVALGRGIDRAALDWKQEQKQALARGLGARLSAAGPWLALAPEGNADVVVRAAELPEGRCGSYHPGEQFVEVDPRCDEGTIRRVLHQEVAKWWTWRNAVDKSRR